jgi:putative aldouronate transport system permease protein
MVRVKSLNRIRSSPGEKVFDFFNVLFFVVLIFVMLFPLWNVLMVSLVTIGEFYSKPLILWPAPFNFDNYRFIFSSDKIVTTFGVTAFVTVAGTAYSVLITAMLAYGLSKKGLPARKTLMALLTFTMFFSGGLIPYFLLIKGVAFLYNHVWVMIIPNGVSIWNFIIMKTYFQQMPDSLEESAKIDGANDISIFVRIVLPLSMPIIATFSLFNAVGFWNTYYDALLFIQNRKLHPLQLVLRQMIVEANMPPEMAAKFTEARGKEGSIPIFEEGLKMASVIVATVPLLCIYPWLQKYFAKGVMIGSVKA